MLVKRQMDFLRELIKTTIYYPAKHYANLLNVSERTIRIDMDVIETVVRMHNLKIKRVQGKGIILEGKKEDKQRLIISVDQSANSYSLAPAERQIHILESLLNGENLSYNILSDKYLTSRSSIANDFKQIKLICKSEQVDLQYNNDGTRLIGIEKNVQSLLKKIYLKKFGLRFNRFPTNFLEYRRFLLQETHLNKQFVDEIFNIICLIGEKYNLADYYLINLQNSLIALCHRIFKGYHHDTSDGFTFEKINQLETYYIANEIAENLQHKLGLTFYQVDILCINECLVANGIENLNITQNKGFYSKLVDHLIVNLSSIIGTDLTGDDKLHKGLVGHIVPMVYRLNNKIKLQNPLIADIKKQYGIMFNITWFLLLDLESELNIRIPEDEIGFLMVHFQSALERHTDIKRFLILCPKGMVTSELLETRIKKYLPSLNLYEIGSLNNIVKYDLKKFDYIISTVPLEEDILNGISSRRIIHLSPVPTDTELNELASYIKNTPMINKERLMKITNQQHGISEYLNKDSIIINQDLATREDILKILLEHQEKQQVITENYPRTVIKREETSSTSLGSGVALPHGNPEYVKKTTITILVNKKKVIWGEDKVDIVLLLSIAKEDMSKVNSIITPIYELISDRKRLESVLLNQSTLEIYHYFNQILQKK